MRYLRVISGSARGIRLNTIESMGTRPTTDRVKEAIFSSVQPYINGAKGLDLFTGSGALGIELLSRGADTVLFVERNKKLERIIKENLEKTRLTERATLCIQDVYSVLQRLAGECFDIIFMDPPYLTGDVENVLSSIVRLKLLAEGGIIVVEHDIADTFGERLPEGLVVEKTKKYGKIGVSYIVEAE